MNTNYLSNISGGWPTHLFENPPSEDFECPLCFMVFREPTQCQGGHVFCKSCIFNVLESKEECPFCRTHLAKAQLSQNLAVKNMIDKFQIRCITCLDNSSKPICTWVGQIMTLESHLSRNCARLTEKCPYESCDVVLPSGPMAEHKAFCIYRPEVCSYCNQQLKAHEKDDHEIRCDDRLILCGNGCKGVLSFSRLSAHIQSCPFQEVACPLAQAQVPHSGCPGRLLRRDIDSHITTPICMSAMLLNLTRRVNDLQHQVNPSSTSVSSLPPVSIATSSSLTTSSSLQSLSLVNQQMAHLSITPPLSLSLNLPLSNALQTNPPLPVPGLNLSSGSVSMGLGGPSLPTGPMQMPLPLPLAPKPIQPGLGIGMTGSNGSSMNSSMPSYLNYSFSSLPHSMHGLNSSSTPTLSIPDSSSLLSNSSVFPAGVGSMYTSSNSTFNPITSSTSNGSLNTSTPTSGLGIGSSFGGGLGMGMGGFGIRGGSGGGSGGGMGRPGTGTPDQYFSLSGNNF